MLVYASIARGQVAPEGAVHPSVGAGAGLGAASSPTGGFSTAVPLELPTPPARLPVPVSIVYTGPSRDGDAGVGWEVPISYVRRQTSTWKRKPSLDPTNGGEGAERLIVSLNGSTHLMVRRGNVFVPYAGSQYMELKHDPLGWGLKTLDNIEYRFTEARTLPDGPNLSDLWLLTSVHDAAGNDEVKLSYDFSGGEIALASVQHTFADKGKALYEIHLRREAVAGDHRWGVVSDDGIRFQRSKVIKRVEVMARDNHAPDVEPKVIRTYHLAYADDPDTYKPRLRSVTTTGEAGVPGPELPVASYEYGGMTILDQGEPALRFGPFEPVARNVASQFRHDLATTETLDHHLTAVQQLGEPLQVHALRETTRARHLIRDFTGDGLPDLVYKDGGTWKLVKNRLGPNGPDLSGPPTSTWSEPAELQWETTFRFTRAVVPRERWAREEMITTETWTDFMDWNGDGRLDIIDARGGDDAVSWKVWLNRESPNGGVAWTAFQVDVSTVRAYLEAQGFQMLDESVRFPFVDWPYQMPLARTRSWPRVRTWGCVSWTCDNVGADFRCDPAPPCDPPPGFPSPGTPDQVDTMKEWSIADANGDSYPDVLTATIPVRECERDIRQPHIYDEGQCLHDPPLAPDEDLQFGFHDPGTFSCGVEHREGLFAGIPGNLNALFNGCGAGPPVESQIATFLNHHGAYVGAAGSPFPEEPKTTTAGYPAGVEHWTTGANNVRNDFGPAAGVSWQATGWSDPEGDGVAERFYRNSIGSTPSFQTNRHERCAPDDTTHPVPYESWQSAGVVDLNGDGRGDYVYSTGGLGEGQTRSWFVRFSDGVQYRGVRRLLFPGFALSDAYGDCVDSAQTDAGLTDLDGDGFPEVLRVSDGVLYRSKMLAQGPDNLAIGRLTAIKNGHGATMHIRYANAKTDQATPHAVPFPEVVVAETSTTIDGSGTALPTTVNGYGNASLAYEPLSGQWSFRGYRRQFSVTGAMTPSGEVDGILTLTDRGAAAPPGSSWSQHVTAEQVTWSKTAEGLFGPQQFPTVLENGVTPIAESTASYQAQPIAPSVYAPAPLDCADLDPVAARPFGTARCTAGGVIYAASTQSWEGDAAPPSAENVQVGSTVLQVDVYGRPVRMMYSGDLRRTDDDVCTQIDFATSLLGGVFPSVPSRLVVTDCGWGAAVGGVPGAPQTLSSSRFFYDGKLFGQVVLGRLTKREVDRFDATGYVETIVADRITYDEFAEVATVESGGHNGGPTRLVTLTRDAFGATVTRAVESASDVSEGIQTKIFVSSLPSRPSSSTNNSGVVSTITHDGFGRKTREYLTHGVTRTLLRRIEYDDTATARAVKVEVFPGNTDLADENASTDKQVGRVVIDALGRPRFTVRELGGDYSGKRMIEGLVTYDELGRVVFAAAPFATTDPNFAPDPQAVLYGSTAVYDRRGQVVREVTAYGHQPGATETSVSTGVFVRRYEHDYMAGQRMTAARGADENDPASESYGFVDESWQTALGREVLRVRRDQWRNRKDTVRQDWDRLGRMTTLRRYLDPMGGNGEVAWTSEFDSLGRRLATREPGMSTVYAEYDEFGNQVESWWMDGPKKRTQRTVYDGFGRETERILSTLSGLTEEVESHDLLYYDHHSGNTEQPVGDFAGRLSWVQTLGVGAVFYGYDELGRANSSAYIYDGHGGVVRQASHHAGGGRLETLTFSTPYTNDEINYQYDSAERMRSVLRGSDPLAQVERMDPKGRIQRIRYGNDATEDFEYSPFAREELETWTTRTASGSYVFENLELDGAGRLKWERQTTPTGSTLFAYEHDGLGRLSESASSTGGLPSVEKYTHDPLGNLVTRQSTTASDLAYQYDPVDLDRLCRAAAPGTTSPCTFAYDGAGNVRGDAFGTVPRNFTYDAAQRLVAVKRGANVVKFWHGPLGRAHTGVTTPAGDRDVWHFGLIEERWLSDLKHIERKVPGPLGAKISLRTEVAGTTVVDETVIYAHGDGRGERVFTGPNAAVVQSATYGTFGQTSSTTTGNALSESNDLWNGGDNFPEVGVVILGPRAYDPELGRFLQRDPFSVTARSSTANPYAFAFSNPVDFSDPTGLLPGLNEQIGVGLSYSLGESLFSAASAGYAAAKAARAGDSAEPSKGVGASGFDTWFVKWLAPGSILNPADAGGPCDNAFCSALDGSISTVGNAYMDIHGAFWRGQMEGLGEMAYATGEDAVFRTASRLAGGPVGEFIYNGYVTSEVVKSAPAIAAAVAADPAQIVCHGDECGIDDLGRVQGYAAGAILANAAGDAILEGILERFLLTALARVDDIPTLTRRQAHMIVELRKGGTVWARNVKEARKLIANMQDLTPHPSGRFNPTDPAPRGTFRGDIYNTRAPRSPYIHDPMTSPKHYHTPHYNLYFHSGQKGTIFVRSGGD